MTNQRISLRFLSRLGAVSVLTLGLVAGVQAPALAYSTTTDTTESAREYVALGDSFTSGQGAPPYAMDGTFCLRSKFASYPALTARLSAALDSPYRLVANLACSGASTANVADQLAGVSKNTALVTLTVGGIDAGSNTVLAACATTLESMECLGAINNSVKQLNGLAPKLIGTYALVAAAAPHAKIAVLSYPRQFKPGISPLGNVLNDATDALNIVIKGSVAAMPAMGIKNVHFVDASQEFAGHEIGTRVPFFAFDPLHLLAPANFHPNALGNSFGYTRALANERMLRG